MYEEFKIEVRFPTENGFIGRKCKNLNCLHYFKVDEKYSLESIYCPYCGESFDAKELLTTDQSIHKDNSTNAEIQYYTDKMAQELLRKVTKGSQGMIFTPANIQKKNVIAGYSERIVDSEINCPECKIDFQVNGIFGYCPGCKSENLLIYDANIKIIENEINTSTNPERQLRHAYSDLVSTFERYCVNKSALIDDSNAGSFQNIYDARRYFKKVLGINILIDVTNDQDLAMRRTFQKRHLYTHSQGIINEKYIKYVPEDKCLINQRALLSFDELKNASEGIRKALYVLMDAMEQKG